MGDRLKFVLAPDSFKESMTAIEAAAAMEAGVRRIYPDAVCVRCPMADGGEGFARTVAAATGSGLVEVPVHDPLGRPVTAELALDGATAVIEAAQAVGLSLVDADERAIMASDTRGVGDLIGAALDAGASHLVIGLGGTATSDGGAGMLAALGVRFLDASGRVVPPTPDGLASLDRVDASGLDPRLRGVRIEAACDVTNPLLGPPGAAAVFAPQKGATPDEVAEIDRVIGRLVALSPEPARAATVRPGAGAAGGLGWALLGYLGATMRPGVDLVAEAVDLEDACRDADAVFTGEGSVDAQTLNGKTAAGVAAVAARTGVPVVIFAGRVQPDASALLERGVRDLVCITPEGQPLLEALERGQANLDEAVAAYLADTPLTENGAAGRAADR